MALTGIKRLTGLFLLFPIVFFSNDASAKLEQVETCKLMVVGEIKSDIKKKISDQYEKCPKAARWFTSVSLNSLGGDMEASFQAGLFLRAINARATVPQEAVCASSCVFLLAGAVERAVDGSVGIHRPMALAASENMQSAQQKQNQLRNSIKNYLQTVSVPYSLFEDMNTIPIDQIKWLSQGELEKYLLIGSDPAWEDLTRSNWARHYGVSKKDYLNAEYQANDACNKQIRSGRIVSESYCLHEKLNEKFKRSQSR